MSAQIAAQSTPSHTTHAVVIGGSIAGLWAARVLSDHFDRVTVIDRDHFPKTPEFRKGAPQSRHIHTLLGRGQQIMEQLFPGLIDEVVATGALNTEWAFDSKTMISTAEWLPRYHSGYRALSATRHLLEWAIRRRLMQNERVSFLEGHAVDGLLTDFDQRTVTGVRVRALGAARETLRDTERLDADLVVDASGRTSHAPEWLQSLGYGAPEESEVNSFLAYSTRWYKRPANFKGDWNWLLIQGTAPMLPRGGGVYEVENGLWGVTLVGAMRDYPPTDEEGFMAFARTLNSPELYEAIKDAEPVTPIYGYQRTANVWRHYEKFARWPEAFVVMGDAACAFNPVYGQGMTVSAMGAMALGDCIRERGIGGKGMAQRFQKRLAKTLETPWVMATGEDFRYPTTEGSKPSVMNHFMHWYMDRLFGVMVNNPGVMQVFMGVMHLLEPSSKLLRPDIFLKVLRHRPVKYSPPVPAPLPIQQPEFAGDEARQNI
jgi:2-polyprenyl-6-methoxyphenol hydroxylase-like FAD-dependent oxidoreductase